MISIPLCLVLYLVYRSRKFIKFYERIGQTYIQNKIIFPADRKWLRVRLFILRRSHIIFWCFLFGCSPATFFLSGSFATLGSNAAVFHFCPFVSLLSIGDLCRSRSLPTTCLNQVCLHSICKEREVWMLFQEYLPSYFGICARSPDQPN